MRLRLRADEDLAALGRGTGDVCRKDATGQVVSALGALAVCGLRGCHWPDLRLIHDHAVSCLGCRVMAMRSKDAAAAAAARLDGWAHGGFVGLETGLSTPDPLLVVKGGIGCRN